MLIKVKIIRAKDGQIYQIATINMRACTKIIKVLIKVKTNVLKVKSHTTRNSSKAQLVRMILPMS